jgi:hypothetical protein
MLTIFNANQADAAERAGEAFTLAAPRTRMMLYSHAEVEKMMRELVCNLDGVQLAIFLQMQRALCAVLDEVTPGGTPISIDSHLPQALVAQAQAACDASFGALSKVAA